MTQPPPSSRFKKKSGSVLICLVIILILHVYPIINIDIEYYITYFFSHSCDHTPNQKQLQEAFDSQFEETTMFNHYNCRGPPITQGVLDVICEAGEKGRENLEEARRKSNPTPRTQLQLLHQRSNNSSTMTPA